MKPFVKVCGLTRLEDALLAADLGASALGFILYPPSPRAIQVDALALITAELPPDLPKVGVFVNAEFDEMLAVAEQANLTHLQLHGNESPEALDMLQQYLSKKQSPLKLIKALRLNSEKDLHKLECYQGAQLLVDAALIQKEKETIWGGSGSKADWKLASKAAQKRSILLAGGLNPDNIQSAWRAVRPFGFDLSSGLESKPGIKNSDKVKALFEKVIQK